MATLTIRPGLALFLTRYIMLSNYDYINRRRRTQSLCRFRGTLTGLNTMVDSLTRSDTI